MVTKKARRKQIAHASAQRTAARRQQRDTRRKRLRALAAVLVVALAIGALAVWIVLHNSDSTSPRASGVYYDDSSVAHPQR